jgi:hypothetical protein
MQKVGLPTKYFKYTECTPGQVLVDGGVYTGQSEGKFGRQNNFVKAGQKTTLNSAGHLNYLLDNYVTEGNTVTVNYVGLEKLGSGKFAGKDVHQFEVFVHTEIPNQKVPAPTQEAPVQAPAQVAKESVSLLDRLNS